MIPNLRILSDVTRTFAINEENTFLKRMRHIFIELDNIDADVLNKYSGIDPGTAKLGIVDGNHLCEIEIIRADTSERRIHHIWRLLRLIMLPNIKYMTIEGASYMDRYRQVELQDIRCGATCWAMNDSRNIEVQIVPPLTIRKVVFGSAKIKNPWKELGIPDNAAAALGCALYPIMKGK